MALYLMNAKYSNAAYKGMVDTPQDRAAAARKLGDALEMKCTRFISVLAVQRLFSLWKQKQIRSLLLR